MPLMIYLILRSAIGRVSKDARRRCNVSKSSRVPAVRFAHPPP